MAENNIPYRQNSKGIYVPLSSWAEINETMEYGESLGKAVQQGRALSIPEQKSLQMYKKMGALYSTFHASLFANATTYGASDKPLGTASHRMLRAAAKRSTIDAAIINARRIQVSHVAKRVVVEGKQKGVTVRHKRFSDATFKNTSRVKTTCREIEDVIFKGVNRDVHGSGGFRDFMVKVIQDEIIVDRKCFQYNATLETDRGPMWIGTIVQQRLPVKIKSIDLETGNMVWGQVTDWQIIKYVDEWITLDYRAGNRFRSLVVTPDHEVWTQRGMVAASELTLKDSVYASSMRISPEQEQVILGGLLGDMYFLHKKRSLPSLKVTRTRKYIAAREYFDWQVRNFSCFSPSVYQREVRAVVGEDKWHPASEMQMQASPAFLPYVKLCRSEDGKRRITWRWMSKIEGLGLATWIMDDASFVKNNSKYGVSVGNSLVCNLSVWVDDEEKQVIERYFTEKWGLAPYWCQSSQESISDVSKQKWSIQFRVEETKKLLAIIAPYVQPCLDEEWIHGEGRKRWVAQDIPQGTEGMVPIPLRAIKRKKAARKKRVAYDVTVEPTHTIVAHHLVTSNCMVIMRDRRGRPMRYHTIPPDDVKPRLEVLLKYMPRVPGNPLYQKYSQNDVDRARDYIFQQFDVDVTEAAYVQEIDNIVTGAWTTDEMSIDITAPVNEIDHAFYGMSNLERSLEVTYLLIQAFNQNKEIFNQEMPDAFLVLNGDVSPEGLEEFKRKIKAEGERTRVGVLATGDVGNTAEMMKVRDSPKDAEMVQMIRILSSVKCAFHRAHTSLINLNPDKGGDQSVISNTDNSFEIDLAQEEGLGSLLENSAFWLTRELIEPFAEWEEYEVVVDLPKQQTEQEVVELWTARTTNTHTVDAALAAQGFPTLTEQTGGRVRGDYINNQFFFQAQQVQQAEMQQTLGELMGQDQSGLPPEQDDHQQGWTIGGDDRPQKRPVEKSWRLE